MLKYYLTHHDLTALTPIYEGLLASYVDDAAKYSSNRTMFHVLRHAIESAPLAAGTRIRFQGFGNSPYRSREMGEALRTLERAMLVYLLFPVTTHELPILPDRKRSPRLQFLDTGLMNYRAGLQRTLVGLSDLNSLYRGRVSEQLIGQELLATSNVRLSPPLFWVREKAGARAELDFVYLHKGALVPVEAKSGTAGTLRSLHQYVSASRCPIAVRLYSGPLSIDSIRTPDGVPFRLLNLPYYLAAKLGEYLDWVETISR